MPGDRPDQRGKPPFDPEIVRELVGKHILIGLTVYAPDGTFVEQKQFHGDVIRANPTEGIVVKLRGGGGEYKLPPDTSALKPAPPGKYTLRSTGEVITDPDFETMWVVRQPKPD